MSSESSPSPDGTDKSKKNKSRKPDIQLYVPRGKRTELQSSKSKNRSSNEVEEFCPTKFVEKSEFCPMKFIEKPPNVVDNNGFKKTSETSDSWNHCAEADNGSSAFFNDGELLDAHSSVSHEKCRNSNWRTANRKNSNSQGFYDPTTTLIFERQTPSNDKYKKLTPNSMKMPHQQIEAMLKMYNIAKPMVDEHCGTPIDDALFLNVPSCSPAVKGEPDDAEFSSADAATSSPAINAAFVFNEDVLVFPAEVSSANVSLNKNEADSILDSLPTSYDEFECTADLSAKRGEHSPPQSATTPQAAAPGAVQFFLDSSERTSNSSPSMIDPDDLEVQLINESFEEQLKQAQVLSNVKTKEAFYRQPNLDASTSNSAGEKSKMLKNKFEFATPTVVPLNGKTSDKQGVTWAGWGAPGVDGSIVPEQRMGDQMQISCNSRKDSNSSFPAKKSSSSSTRSSTSSSTTAKSSLEYQETEDMDMLSKAMIDKVLSGDDDDDLIGGVCQTTSKVILDNNNSATKKEEERECDGNTPPNTSAVVADSWEDILDKDLMQDLHLAVKKTSLEESPKTIDYTQFKPRNKVEITSCNDFVELGHVLEAYGFPSSTQLDMLRLSIQQLDCKQFNIHWVDETHALIVCVDTFAAKNILNGYHPVVKLRPLSQASTQSKKKAKEYPDLLQTFKARPETNASLARRLVESHLGKKTCISQDHRLQERQKIQIAKEQKKLATQIREDVWEGRV